MAKLKPNTTINGNIVWHAGNDGAGSGLDADLLDGKHASDLAVASHNHDAAYVKLAGSTMAGKLVVPAGATGGVAFPDNAFGGSGDTASITLQNPDGSELQELTIQVANDATDIIHLKAPSNNGVKINNNVVWHAGNDGPGSGLNADLLDGIDSSMFLQKSATANTNGYFDTSTTTPTGTARLNYSGDFYATRVFNASFNANDYAEFFRIGEPVEPGDVLIMDNGLCYKSAYKKDKRVVGVVSDTYGHCLGGTPDLDGYAAIGLAGRVKVKVSGNIKAGDKLASGKNGIAVKTRSNDPAVVIGKALEPHKGKQIDRIVMKII